MGELRNNALLAAVTREQRYAAPRVARFLQPDRPGIQRCEGIASRRNIHGEGQIVDRLHKERVRQDRIGRFDHEETPGAAVLLFTNFDVFQAAQDVDVRRQHGAPPVCVKRAEHVRPDRRCFRRFVLASFPALMPR